MKIEVLRVYLYLYPLFLIANIVFNKRVNQCLTRAAACFGPSKPMVGLTPIVCGHFPPVPLLPLSLPFTMSSSSY